MLIGPGGKNIRSIQEDTGSQIDIDEDGTVTIAAANEEALKAALLRVEAVTATVQVGRTYDGTVSSIKDFGAFIEIIPGKDGPLPHQRTLQRVRFERGRPAEVGDTIKVKVISVDEQDRVKLSHKAVLTEQAAETATADSSAE